MRAASRRDSGFATLQLELSALRRDLEAARTLLAARRRHTLALVRSTERAFETASLTSLTSHLRRLGRAPTVVATTRRRGATA